VYELLLSCIIAFNLLNFDMCINRHGGQLIYTKTECFPSDNEAVEVKLSDVDTPELMYVQLCGNLDRFVVHFVQH